MSRCAWPFRRGGTPRHLVLRRSEEGDLVFEDSGVTIAVAAIQVSLLRGATIDYVSAGGRGRFEVTNHNLMLLSTERLRRPRASSERARGGRRFRGRSVTVLSACSRWSMRAGG